MENIYDSRYRLDPGTELAESGNLCHDDFKEDSDENIIKLIQEKDKDLLLAAELGKALLDKNEEISHNRERIVLDYTQRLEVGQGKQIVDILVLQNICRSCLRRSI